MKTFAFHVWMYRHIHPYSHGCIHAHTPKISTPPKPSNNLPALGGGQRLLLGALDLVVLGGCAFHNSGGFQERLWLFMGNQFIARS